MIAVSPAGWLDLPAYPLSSWLRDKPTTNRLRIGEIKEYMRAYVNQIGIESNMRPFTRVTSVTVYKAYLGYTVASRLTKTQGTGGSER